MPTITLLNLLMSRDSNGVVGIRVDYTLEFSAAEVNADIAFAERVDLVRRVGRTDRHAVVVPGAPPAASQPPGDRPDRFVATLSDSTLNVAQLGLPPGSASVSRSFTRELSGSELAELLEVGREHPYVVVSVSPVEITSDVQLVPVEIDVGDPSAPGLAIDVGGEPVGLAVDGASLYVATKEGAVAQFDRNGGFIQTLPIDGELLAIGFDGEYLWVTRTDNTVVKLDRTGAIVGQFPTGGDPIAIAFGPQAVWIANYGSNTVSRLDRNGVSVATLTVRNGPWSIATTPNGDVLVVSFGTRTVEVFPSGIPTALGRHTVGQSPWAIAVADGVAWVTNFGDNSVSVINLTSASVGSLDVGNGPKGISAGAGAMWVASSLSNELVKVRMDDWMILDTWAVGNEPDAVVFDGDRVFVANRGSGSVSLVRLA